MLFYFCIPIAIENLYCIASVQKVSSFFNQSGVSS